MVFISPEYRRPQRQHHAYLGSTPRRGLVNKLHRKRRIENAIRHLYHAGRELDPIVDDEDEPDLAIDMREPLEQITEAYFCLKKLSEQEEAPP